MAPRRPRKNDEAVESLIRNPSSKTDFRPIGNQQVITNLIFQRVKQVVSLFYVNVKQIDYQITTCVNRVFLSRYF